MKEIVNKEELFKRKCTKSVLLNWLSLSIQEESRSKKTPMPRFFSNGRHKAANSIDL